ncbi:hypothetical protein KCU71_g15523, partial [Aureobasidium melanogenum]
LRFSNHPAIGSGLDSYMNETSDGRARMDDLMERMRKDLAAGTYKIQPEKSHSDGGHEPHSCDNLFNTQLEESLRDLDYTHHLQSHSKSSSQIIMSDPDTQRSNPLDLTKRFGQSTPSTPAKRQKTTLEQTNAGNVRSSPPTSTHPRSLSTVNKPKQKFGHQRTQSQSSQASPGARLQSSINTNMARLRAKTTANITNKRLQSPARNSVEKIFEDLTNDSDSELPPVQPKNSQPPKSMEKLSKQPIFARTRSESSSRQNKRQPSVRPPFVRQDSMPSLLDSEDEVDVIHMSGSRSPLRSSTSKDNPTAEASQLLPSPTLLRNPSTIQTTFQHESMKAVGNVDDRVYRIFKDVALRTSLYVLENTPCHDPLLSAVNSQITTNERNARTVNRSLEEVLDAHNPVDTGLTPKATDHCKLLDKQEKERQKALEGMLEKLEQRKRNKAEVMEAIGAMRKDIKEERDNCHRKEVEGARKSYDEQTMENIRGNDTTEDQASRKRKRDVEREEHMDIDMLM